MKERRQLLEQELRCVGKNLDDGPWNNQVLTKLQL